MEGFRHLDRIIDLINHFQPDCLCLQEAPESFVETLNSLNYQAVFASMQNRTNGTIVGQEGLIIASQLPFSHQTTYYAEVGTKDNPIRIDDRVLAVKFPYILAKIYHPDEGCFNIVTVHTPVTKNGLADENQILAVDNLLVELSQLEPHVLCGDFNMPRGFNHLYNNFIESYTDAIPKNYQSSLDRNLHRLGQRTNLNAPIFDTYMVDYIFTQTNYQADDVELQFGVSDHAAIIANITKIKVEQELVRYA